MDFYVSANIKRRNFTKSTYSCLLFNLVFIIFLSW